MGGGDLMEFYIKVFQKPWQRSLLKGWCFFCWSCWPLLSATTKESAGDSRCEPIWRCFHSMKSEKHTIELMVHRTPAFTSWYGKVFPSIYRLLWPSQVGFVARFLNHQLVSPFFFDELRPLPVPLARGAKASTCRPCFQEPKWDPATWKMRKLCMVNMRKHNPPKFMGFSIHQLRMGQNSCQCRLIFLFTAEFLMVWTWKPFVILSAPNVIHLIWFSSPTKIKVPRKMEIQGAEPPPPQCHVSAWK